MGLDIIRKWRHVAAALSVMCLSAACGGGDNGGGTGPGGGGGDLAGDYQLVGANNETLRVAVTSNVCPPALFTNGSMTLNDDGTFEMSVSYMNAQNAPDGFQDHGRFQRHGTQVEFTSEAWGDQFEAEFNGAVLITQYDFCAANDGAELELDFAF